MHETEQFNSSSDMPDDPVAGGVPLLGEPALPHKYCTCKWFYLGAKLLLYDTLDFVQPAASYQYISYDDVQQVYYAQLQSNLADTMAWRGICDFSRASREITACNDSVKVGESKRQLENNVTVANSLLHEVEGEAAAVRLWWVTSACDLGIQVSV